ncbi:MAG: hypothetical protein HN344_08110, partial [Gammaproteobacteria bacterium]|nr:hypothetical protein [Gammaproteobacteria bacterium]
MSRSSQKVSHWHSTESGSILIIVLWMVTLTAIIATTLATEIRLSSRIVHAQKQKVSEWAETLEALHSAEMELMLHKMPLPVTDNWESMKVGARPAELSFDGSAVTTAYPSPSSMNIHIFDHSGKISLVALTRNRLRMLLLKTVGDDEIALESLLNSWEDWIDKDSLKRINGAEEKFYQALTPPYLPRNGPLDSVEEILDIRGFLPIFGAIELSSAFTLHTTHNTINPNLATLEALHLLPGLSASSIEQIVSLRQEEPFQNMEALTEILPPEEFSVAREW